MRAKLVVVQGKPLGREVPLAMGRFLIGRGADCHLRPASELVSRHHCVLTVVADSIRAEDLGSTNGTLVNGRRIEGEVEITQGDLLEIGPLAFAVRIEEAAEPAAEAAVPQGAPEISSTEIEQADDAVIEWLLDDSQQDMGTTTVVMTGEEAGKQRTEPEEPEEPDEDSEDPVPADEAESKDDAAKETEEAKDEKRSASESASELMRKYYRHGRR